MGARSAVVPIVDYRAPPTEFSVSRAPSEVSRPPTEISTTEPELPMQRSLEASAPVVLEESQSEPVAHEAPQPVPAEQPSPSSPSAQAPVMAPSPGRRSVSSHLTMASAGPVGGLASRSRALRVRRGFATEGAIPVTTDYSPPREWGSSPTDELRQRAQRLRSMKGSLEEQRATGAGQWRNVGMVPADAEDGGGGEGGDVSVEQPSLSSRIGSPQRAASPWRSQLGSVSGTILSSRQDTHSIAESKSVRSRAFDLLQAKKAPSYAGASTAGSIASFGARARTMSPERATSPSRLSERISARREQGAFPYNR